MLPWVLAFHWLIGPVPLKKEKAVANVAALAQISMSAVRSFGHMHAWNLRACKVER